MPTRQMHCPNFITLQTIFLGVGIFFSVSVFELLSFNYFLPRWQVCRGIIVTSFRLHSASGICYFSQLRHFSMHLHLMSRLRNTAFCAAPVYMYMQSTV